MMRRLQFLFLIVFLLGIAPTFAQRIVGYYPYYRTFSTFDANIRWDCITDVNYAFAFVDGSGNLTIQTPTNFSGVQSRCKPISSTGPNLWMSIGGVGQASSFSSTAASGSAITTMVNQAKTMCTTYNLAGIDLDWEFPTSAADQTNMLTLINSMSTALHAMSPARQVSITVGGEYNAAIASPTHLSYYSSSVLNAADYVNIMTYDLPDGYGTNHSSVVDAENAANAYKTKGGGSFPWSKLLIGIPFYGRAGSGRTSGVTSDYDTDGGYVTAYNSTDGNAGDGYYFNSASMIQSKVSWITTQGGNGVIIWDLGQDRGTPYRLQDVICTAMASVCAPQPNLGADIGVCMPGTISLNSGQTAQSGRTFAWYLDGSSTAISGATSPTYSATTASLGLSEGTHTFTVKITQGSCSKSDIINVVLSNAVTATGGSRCGTGTVTLNITSTGSTYEWYDAATAGNKLGTGSSFVTPSISTTTTYYAQEATGSTTSYTGDPSLALADAFDEFGSDANPGTKPAYAQKFTVQQSLTLSSVTIYTDGTAKTGAQVIAYDATTGAVAYQSTAVNIPAMGAGTPFTISPNINFAAGTYYVGLFVPNTGSGNAHIWMKGAHTATTNYVLTGICTLEPKCYGGNFLVATPSATYYGQLFNWVIITGVSNPCTRTAVTATINNGPAAPTGFAGAMTPCAGSTGNTYSVTNVAGLTYAWTYSGTGATITAGSTTNSITVSYSAAATNGTWTVTPSQSACVGTPLVSSTVTIGALPAQPSTIIVGTATPCPTSTGNTYSVTSVAGVTYAWTYSGTGQTITAGNNTNAITVSYAAGTAGSWTVTPSNTCGTGTVRTTAVTFGTLPAQPSAIVVGTATPCPTSTGNTYSVTSVAGVTYAWTYSGTGQTITAGNNTNAITVSYAAGTAGTWTVTPSNTCGTGTAQTTAVTFGTLPAQPSTIVVGTATPCPTSTGNTYSVTSVAGVTYAWTYSGTGQTITAGNNTNAITVSYASGTAGSWTVTPSNTCGTGTVRTTAVTFGTLPAQPSAIVVGTATPCPTSTGNTYSVTSVAGVTYAWTYSGTGQTITAGNNTNAITVSYAAGTAGTWTVTPSNTCGTGTAQTTAVTFGTLPAQPSTIVVGTATPCPTSTGNTYSVTSVAGVTYAWTYSGTGQTITAGNNTNAITVSYAAGTAGSWTVTPSNTCGTGTVRTTAVTFGTLPAQPSTIVVGTATPCPTSTGNTYSVTSVAGVTYAWTYSGTGQTITAGNNTNAITVSYAAGTAGSWTVTPSNTCGTGTAQTTAVTFGTLPAQPSTIVVGTATPCPTSTGNTYSVTSVAGVTYAWTYSGTGQTITAGNNTNAITVSYAAGTAGSWTVTPSNTCGTGTVRTTAVTFGTLPAQPSTIVVGTATPCPTSTGNTYSVTSVAGVTYAWTYSGTGQTITAGNNTNAITVSYAAGTAGSWTVTPSNTCGTGTAQTTAVTFGTLPAQPSTIVVGTATPCPTSSGNTYSVTSVAGVTYAWTYSGTGQTITAGNNTNAITVSYAAGTAGTWTVTPSNTCGTGTVRTTAVTLGSVPSQPSAITGATTVTQSTTGNAYSVTNVAGVTYAWTYSGTGATINGTGSSVTIDFSSTATSGTLSVTASTACGTSTASTAVITVNAATVPQPGAFTASTASICAPQTGVVYTVPNVAGTTYNWSYSGTGFSITSGAGTNSIVASFTGAATSGTLSVTAQIGANVSTARTLAVTVNTLPSQPSAIVVGTATPCPTSTGNTYSVTSVAGVTYAWTYSGTGQTITAGNNTNAITVSYAAGTAGSWTVTPSNTCGTGTARTTAVTFGTLPAQPSTIVVGTATPCPTSTGNTYSVTSVAGVTYAWTYSGTGQTITAGNNTNAITVSYAAGTSGSWTVTPSNTCGLGAGQSTVVTLGAVPAQPSVITASIPSPCPTSVNNIYSVTNVAGVTYAWTYSGTGQTITAGNNTNAITVSYAAGTSGSWTVTPSNTCGAGTVRTTAVTLGSVPSQPSAITGATTVTQSTTGNAYSVTNVAGVTYAWSYSGTGATINGTGSSVTIDFSSTATSGTLSVTASTACGTSTASTAVITVNAATVPQPGAFTASTASICAPQTGVVYTVPNVAGTTYNWSYSGTGFSITSGAGTNSIVASFTGAATSGTLSVTAQIGANVSTARTLAVTVSTAPSQPSAITGATTVTQSTTGNAYSVTNVAGVTYAWTYSGTGATINGTGSSVTIDFSSTATSGTLSVTASTACGTSTASTLAITVNAATVPQPGAFTASTASICAPQTGVVYTVPNVAGTTYNWSYSGTGFSITSGAGTNSIVASFTGAATSGTLSVTAQIGANVSTARTLAVTVSTAPSQPSAITGATTVTQSTTGNAYSVTNVAGVTYAWTYSGTGATINGTGSSVTIDFSSTATSGTLSVTASTACGTSTASTLAITVNAATVPQPGAFTASTASICAPQTGVVYTVPNVAGTTYNWSYSGTGFSITSGAGTNSIVASFTGAATSGTLSVTAQIGANVSTARTLAVTVNTLPSQPSAIVVGTATPCPTSTGNTYSVTSVAGVTYAWTYSGTGQTITAGNNTNAITVSYAAGTAGSWTVTPSNSCGSGTAQSTAVSFSVPPVSAGAIGGTFTVSQSQSGVAYSVPNVAGLTYNWTYSGTGATINGTGSSITIDYSSSATSGTLSVTATNSCGGSSPASTQAITVNPSGTTPQPGAFTTSSASVCQGANGVTYTVPAVASTAYSWSYSGVGATFHGSGNSITIDFSMTATSGTLSVVANNGSGNSPARTMSIVVNQVAAAPSSISGSATATAGQTGVAYFVTAQAGITFTWDYTGTGVTIVSGQGSNAITVNYSSTATSGDIEVSASNGSCGQSTPTPMTITISPATGVEAGQSTASYELEVYPNPATTAATVELNMKQSTAVKVSVYDMLGTEVKVIVDNEVLSTTVHTFSIDDLAYGIYFVRAKSGDELVTVKLIKY